MKASDKKSESDTIEGTATISIRQLDEFRQQKEIIEQLQKDKEDTKKLLKKLVHHLDDEKYTETCKEIDAMKNVSDRQVNKMLREAGKTIEIYVDAAVLKKIIRKYIEPTESDGHYEIALTRADETDDMIVHLYEPDQEEEE